MSKTTEVPYDQFLRITGQAEVVAPPVFYEPDPEEEIRNQIVRITNALESNRWRNRRNRRVCLTQEVSAMSQKMFEDMLGFLDRKQEKIRSLYRKKKTKSSEPKEDYCCLTGTESLLYEFLKRRLTGELGETNQPVCHFDLAESVAAHS